MLIRENATKLHLAINEGIGGYVDHGQYNRDLFSHLETKRYRNVLISPRDLILIN